VGVIYDLTVAADKAVNEALMMGTGLGIYMARAPSPFSSHFDMAFRMKTRRKQ